MPKFTIPSDDELKTTPYYFGQKEIHFLPKQWEFVFAPEMEIGYLGGFGSGKTQTGIMRATRLSTWYPGNRGIIGRYASTDLAATTQRDALEFWREANLLDDFKERGKYKTPTAVLRCVDPMSQRILPGKTSEVQFLHLDDPQHIHGHKVGWFWADEVSEISREAWNRLHSRMRLPGFAHIYSAFGTGNPEGHNWPYLHFFDPEEMAKLKAVDRRKRRGIHATSYENWFLEPEYLENMLSTFSPAFRKKYIEASFDVFEGQIYNEFETSVHVFSRHKCFRKGIPEHWTRVLGVDVGGTHPWAWIFVAVDDLGNLIVYDEIHGPGTRIAPFVTEAKLRIGNLKFRSMVIDYENKLAAGELAEHGIRMTNAQKTNKMETVLRLSGYLHPNERRAYPAWHPDAGKPGSPGIFFADTCKNLIAEMPQQRWRKIRGQETLANEIDPTVANDCCDALGYCIRELPKPSTLEHGVLSDIQPEMSAMGKMMNFHKRNAKEQKRRNQWDVRMGYGRRQSPPHRLPETAPIFDAMNNAYRGIA